MQPIWVAAAHGRRGRWGGPLLARGGERFLTSAAQQIRPTPSTERGATAVRRGVIVTVLRSNIDR